MLFVSLEKSLSDTLGRIFSVKIFLWATFFLPQRCWYPTSSEHSTYRHVGKREVHTKQMLRTKLRDGAQFAGVGRQWL